MGNFKLKTPKKSTFSLNFLLELERERRMKKIMFSRRICQPQKVSFLNLFRVLCVCLSEISLTLSKK